MAGASSGTPVDGGVRPQPGAGGNHRAGNCEAHTPAAIPGATMTLAGAGPHAGRSAGQDTRMVVHACLRMIAHAGGGGSTMPFEPMPLRSAPDCKANGRSG